MKKRLVLMLGVSLLLCISFGTAQAAFSLSVFPTDPVDAQALSTITFDVYFNTGIDETYTAAGWDIDMGFDTTELTNPTYSNQLGGITTNTSDTINYLYGFLPPPLDPPQVFSADSSNLLISLTFDIINSGTLFDGLADFWVASSEGTTEKGFVDLAGAYTQFPRVDGADVGVPIPGAFFLLGSGLVGLVALRRKFS